ncbi:MAG: SusC/RagA family TonB-linked outer membrane protein [Gemmatimonadaceae bacterium]
MKPDSGPWGSFALGLALAAMLVCAPTLGAQATGTVEGVITEVESGQPLSDAQVRIVGTTLGRTTGRDGSYAIPGVPAGPVTVRASLIGFARQEMTVTVVAGQSVTANFDMREVAITLQEVIVTGTAGGQEKVSIGNAVSVIKVGDELEDAPISNVTELLTARTPGLTLMSNSGQTGSSSNIRIRGAGSLAGGYAPVFYVDGIRIESGLVEDASTYQGGTALDYLNPEDIESIEVIKGPAAATLYGADAANGVIQIITKKGRRGAQGAQWTASIEVGENEWTENVGSNTTYWRCTAEQQQDVDDFPGCAVAAGNASPDNVQWWAKDSDGDPVLRSGIPESDIIDVGDGTFVIQDNPLFRHPAALRTGKILDFDLSVRGGTEAMGYFLSFNRNAEDGVFFNNFSRRMGGRANFDVQLSPTFDVAAQFGYTRTHLQQPLANNASDGVNRNGMRGRARATDDPWEPGFRGFSPWVSNEFDRQNRLERMTIGLTGNWVPFEWFRHRLTLGLDRQSYRETEFFRQDTTGRAPWGSTEATGTISHELPTIHRWTADYSGSVDYDLNADLATVSSAGVQLNARQYRGFFAIGEGLVADKLNLVSGAASRTSDEQLSEQTSLGFYVQEQLGWRERLYLTGAVRVDDNSAFGEEFSLEVYPKASVSWLISDEPFFNLAFADQVKLRAAWGKAGNAPGPFTADRTYGSGRGVRGDELVNTLGTESFGNPDLRAETGVEWETGFDASLLGGRAGIEFTYYDKRTVDALVSIPDPGSTGFIDNHLINVGEISNKGIELFVSGTPIDVPRFTWDAGVVFSTNKNRLESFNGSRTEIIFGSFADVQRHREGYVLGGFWATDVERDANGDPVLRDNNGVIVTDPDVGDVTVLNSCRWAPDDPTWNREAECDDIFVGPSRPTREAALTNTFTLFGDFRIFTQFDYRGGHYQWCAICSINSRVDLNTWDVNTGGTALNPDVSEADVLALRSLQTLSHISSADFVKFRELSLTYAIPERWTRFGGRWSLTVSGRNLAIWTRYEGRGDPEVQFDPGSAFSMTDYASTPQTRRLSVSARVSF